MFMPRLRFELYVNGSGVGFVLPSCCARYWYDVPFSNADCGPSQFRILIPEQ
jgi:hypothetical protein